jgi:hypothetical protein
MRRDARFVLAMLPIALIVGSGALLVWLVPRYEVVGDEDGMAGH